MGFQEFTKITDKTGRHICTRIPSQRINGGEKLVVDGKEIAYCDFWNTDGMDGAFLPRTDASQAARIFAAKVFDVDFESAGRTKGDIEEYPPESGIFRLHCKNIKIAAAAAAPFTPTKPAAPATQPTDTDAEVDDALDKAFGTGEEETAPKRGGRSRK